MVLDVNRAVIELEHRGIVPVEDAMGARVDCLRGCVWITEQGCTDDIVLEAGESHDIARPGVAVVQALGNAVIALQARAAPCAGLAGMVGRPFGAPPRSARWPAGVVSS